MPRSIDITTSVQAVADNAYSVTFTAANGVSMPTNDIFVLRQSLANVLSGVYTSSFDAVARPVDLTLPVGGPTGNDHRYRVNSFEMSFNDRDAAQRGIDDVRRSVKKLIEELNAGDRQEDPVTVTITGS